MKKTVEEAIKEHLRANAFVSDPDNLHFVDRFYEQTKAAEWGAKWRINSVWHDVEEKPNHKQTFIYQAIRKSGEMYYGINSIFGDDEWAFLNDFVIIERWAYIDDLLPEKKGGNI